MRGWEVENVEKHFLATAVSVTLYRLWTVYLLMLIFGQF